MKLWLMHIEPFHRYFIRCVADHGIAVTYACGTPERLRELSAAPDCMLHSGWDAMRGRLPPGLAEAASPRPASAALLEKLAPGEATALLMFDRLNWNRDRIQDLRRAYLDCVAMWSSLLELARPDAVVFQTVPHVGYDYVLYLLCRSIGIRTLIVERTSIPDRLILVEHVDERPRAPAEALRAASRTPAASTGRDYYDKRNSLFRLRRESLYSRWDFAKLAARAAASLAYQFASRPLRMLEPMHSSLHGLEEHVPSRGRHLWRYFLDRLRMGWLRVYYESGTIAPDLAARYVYFPLHHQPERSSLPMGLCFSDQLLALDIVAHALPPGWLVYVKEHPRQFLDNSIRSRMARNRAFYDRLQRHERVRLVSPHAPSDELAARSQCTATVAGTGGWEAVGRGVPVVVFGEPWYRHCPGVEQVGSVAECAAAFRRVMSGEFRVDPARVRAYRDWIANEGGFRGYPSAIFAHESALTPEENGRSYAEAVVRRLTPAVPMPAVAAG